MNKLTDLNNMMMYRHHSIHVRPPHRHGRVLLPGGGASVLPHLRLLSALPQALAGIRRHPPDDPQPPQLQGQHHAKEREVHAHGVQGTGATGTRGPPGGPHRTAS